MTRRIVIVGAGYCGTITAVSLLRALRPDSPTQVVLLERGPAIGPGVAYAARESPFLLNVPAGRLSVDAKDPLQFLRFAQASMPQAGPEDFLPRSLYGEYLQRVLAGAEHSAAPGVRLVRMTQEAVSVSIDAGEARVNLANGTILAADRVVLATGNAAPGVMPWARGVADHPAFFADPWTLPRHLTHGQVAVIIGSGLTMADVVFSLSDAAGRSAQILSISRRGALPQTQTTFSPRGFAPPTALLAHATSCRRLLAATRALADTHSGQSGDWREVITAIRGLAPQLWREMPDPERRRFLRHAQVFWDVHRHRLPPAMAMRMQSLQSEGTLQVRAGRVLDAHAQGDRIVLTWRARGTEAVHSVLADAVVNATGPNYCLNDSSEPLLKSLVASGMISADNLSLGLRTDSTGACIDSSGTPSARLFYLGPMLRASYWEATATSELKQHAERMVPHLLRAMGT